MPKQNPNNIIYKTEEDESFNKSKIYNSKIVENQTVNSTSIFMSEV